jgi:hypothetical protein
MCWKQDFDSWMKPRNRGPQSCSLNAVVSQEPPIRHAAKYEGSFVQRKGSVAHQGLVSHLRKTGHVFHVDFVHVSDQRLGMELE